MRSRASTAPPTGTGSWTTTATKAFTKSFGAEPTARRRRRPRRPATCRRILYADACERAGTFNPPEVIKALEGFEFDGLGNGPTLYRAADHQCFKDVLVVQGKDKPEGQVRPARGQADRAGVEGHLRPGIFGGELGSKDAKKCG